MNNRNISKIDKKVKRKTKTQLVAEHLLSGRTITQLECTELYHSTRLSSIIHDLRKKGWSIITMTEKHRGGTHGRYVLEKGGL